MSRLLRNPLFVLLVAGLFVLPGAVAAQDYNSYSVSLAAGLGGSLDADSGDGIENTALQVGFSFVTEPRTLVGVRLGRIDFDDDEPLESTFGPELTYLTLAGEYRYNEGVYDSGVYLGIGGYRLEGTNFAGSEVDDTAFGAVLGFTGNFPITRRLAFLVELSGHFADFDDTQFFAIGHGGLSYSF
ncbi:MAG: hypothetical protein AAF604_01900 [Acidobacteriota bacterium]